MGVFREDGGQRENGGQFESSEKPYRVIVDLGAGPAPNVHVQRFVRELHCGRCTPQQPSAGAALPAGVRR